MFYFTHSRNARVATNSSAHSHGERVTYMDWERCYSSGSIRNGNLKGKQKSVARVVETFWSPANGQRKITVLYIVINRA